ncbi:hypothetical protein [Thermococcus sp.]
MAAPSFGGWNEKKSTDNNRPVDFDGSGFTLYRFYNTDHLLNDFFTDGKCYFFPRVFLNVYNLHNYQQPVSVL